MVLENQLEWIKVVDILSSLIFDWGVLSFTFRLWFGSQLRALFCRSKNPGSKGGQKEAHKTKIHKVFQAWIPDDKLADI